MSRTWSCWAARCGALIACLLAAAGGIAQEPAESPALPAGQIVTGPAEPAPVLSLDQLARLTWPELEQLYRQSEAGTIPTGYARGRAIYCPDRKLSAVRSRVTRVLWHGKIFDCAQGTLVNQWCGFRAIEARVDYGPSWLDGKPAIVMDYCGTSRVWADVRDEAREVAPGLYLGRMVRRKADGPQFQCYFVLEAQPSVRACR